MRGFDTGHPGISVHGGRAVGSTVAANNGIEVAPFELGFQAHFTRACSDPVRNRLRAAFGSAGAAPPPARWGPGGVLAPDFAARFTRVLPNQVTAILALKDSLWLTDDQLTRLQAIADMLDADRVLSDSVQAQIQRAGDRPDPLVPLCADTTEAQGRDASRAGGRWSRRARC